MPSVPHPTRRRLLAAGAFAMTGIIGDGGAAAEPLPVTPQCHDGDEPTVRQTAGPYFKPSSPAARRSRRARQQGARWSSSAAWC